MKKCANILIVSACVLLMASAMFIWKGFDHKSNYYQSESYPSLNKNVYVGGDAYNYIINSNYFTGYMVLGSSAGMGAVILISTGLLLNYKSKDKTMDGLKAIYDRLGEASKMPAETSTTDREGDAHDEQSV